MYSIIKLSFGQTFSTEWEKRTHHMEYAENDIQDRENFI